LVVAAAVYRTESHTRAGPGRGIDDSKVVYGRGGRDALARVLGPYLGLPSPVRLSELLSRLSVRGDPRPGYLWYGDVEDAVPHPGPAPPAFRRILVNPVCERDFNEGCAREGGKGGLLFRETMRVVRAALDLFPGEEALVVCDKHGGRNRYAGRLMAALSPSLLVAEREGAALSAYRLEVGGRVVRIRFVPAADATDRAAALASMAAKYVRELFMEGLNRFFAERVRGLRPTAGYYGDARRFARDVGAVLQELPAEAFLRCS
jgi:hypothetical protein